MISPWVHASNRAEFTAAASQKMAPNPYSAVASPAASPDVSGDRLSLSSKVRFGHVLEQNHGVQLPMNVDIGLDQSAQLSRLLLIRAAEKRFLKDESNITLWLDSLRGNGYPAAMNGLADAVRTSAVPVDVVVKSQLATDGLKTLMAASGKRLMMDRARLDLSPPKGWYNGPVHESNARVRLYNETQRNLEWMIMQRAGVTRQALQQDFTTGRRLNALSSLAYGEKGLVDAVIVGENEVLTRDTLDSYYRAKKLHGRKNEALRAAFNRDYDAIDEVVAWARDKNRLSTVQDFSAQSLTTQVTPLELDNPNSELSADVVKKVAALLEQKMSDLSGLGAKVQQSIKQILPPLKYFKLQLLKPDGKRLDAQPGRTMSLKSKEDILRWRLERPEAANPAHTYLRDTVYFPVGFDNETGGQIEVALKNLFDKKKAQQAEGKDISNILIVENSPGGMSLVTEQLKSQIAYGGIPVDVVIQGMGASGGSKLVSMATGNRFMTPNSLILLHQTRGSHGLGNLEEVTAGAEDMGYSSDGYQRLVSQRSGRPLEEVRKDFKLDFWTNPVESIVYGPNGLVDAILVDASHVLLREDVMELIAEYKGGPEAAEAYIEAKFDERRNGSTSAPSTDHAEMQDDPLSNPLAVIDELVSRGKARSLDSVERLKGSCSDVDGERNLDLYNVIG